MTTKLTNGIRVSVKPFFKGRYTSKIGPLYLFGYEISILNETSETVQLMGRHWYIFDTGDSPSEVQGKGVVGEQPILKSGETHTYESGCHLRASIGAMKGHYYMYNHTTQKYFTVNIPTFQFFASSRVN